MTELANFTDKSNANTGDTRLNGLIGRRSRWGLTRRGWLISGSVLLAASIVIVLCIQPFLAVTQPVSSEVLVVEGWVADYVLEESARKVESRDYSMAYVTGGPLELGAPLSEYKTYAALSAAVLVSLGLPTYQVQAVPAPKVRRDRTFTSALALRTWFEKHDRLPSSFNVITAGAHARRTRLLFEKAFGDTCEIGVISVEDESYDPDRWWAYSAGVRGVVGETVAYLYARLFFREGADLKTDAESGENPSESSP